jgi:hypothetical protein
MDVSHNLVSNHLVVLRRVQCVGPGLVAPWGEDVPMIADWEGGRTNPRPLTGIDIVGSHFRWENVLSPTRRETGRIALSNLYDEASASRVELDADEVDAIGPLASQVRETSSEP